ncbi:MAG: cell envelope integrity protein TolA [Ramlibacter sp.]|nr:cell envelope integrity protein TolA [Ramlibacter sp.]
MPSDIERLEFAPPPQPGLVRALVLALIAHLLLMLALTWGISWNRESENAAAEAELWSSVPQQAAPPQVQPPPPAPPPAPAPPAPSVAPPPPPPAPARADIAMEREKLRKELAQRKQEELERQKKLEARKKLEEEREKKLEARKKEEALKKQLLAEKKAADDKRKKEEAAKARQQQLEQEKKLATLRDEQLRRIQGLAGASGGPTATGAAQRSAGPSDSYAGRVRARVRPNVVFTDDIAGNPTAEVEVRMAPDGTITSRRLLKSSGIKSWDEAVLRALDKTEILPRDVDGRVHSPLIIEFRPKG